MIRETSASLSTGTPASSQRITVDLLTPSSWPKPSSVSPFSSRNLVMGDFMPCNVAHIATVVKTHVALQLNDRQAEGTYKLRMMRIPQIHSHKLPIRIHFIAEWAAKRKVSQADMVRALGIDKATVSRWFSGRLPEQPNLFKIAAYLDVEPNDLFHDPEDNWLNRKLRQHTEEERKRMQATLEAAFPQQKQGTGTDG